MVEYSKLRIYAMLLVILTTGCASHHVNLRYNRPSNEEILRDYVFFTCLTKGYGNNPVFLEDVSPSMYNDLSDFEMAHFDTSKKLDSIATKMVTSIQPSTIEDYKGKTTTFAQCLEFYKSKELKLAIKKVLKQAEKERKSASN